MNTKEPMKTSIMSRVGRFALAAILAVALCPGSRELLKSVAYADTGESASALSDASGANADDATNTDAGDTAGASATKGILGAAKPSGGGPLKSDAKPPLRETVDTVAMGVTMNLFNYISEDKNSNWGSPDYTGINAGRNNDNQLMFYAYGNGVATDYAHYSTGENPGNGINRFTGVGTYNGQTKYTFQYANQGIVKSTLSGGYPVLNTNTSDPSTNYLFDPSDTYDGNNKRFTYENVNGLFYLENKGQPNEMMIYDSNKSYAYYNRSQGDNGSFSVYSNTYDRNGGSDDGLKVGFFPFNDWYTGSGYPEINPTKDAWSYQVEHHLGLTLDFPMAMPYDGKIKHVSDNGAVSYQDMVFKFSGDDDMWVFVDDKLVLDIGGIHQPVGGTINFNTGVVQVSYGTLNPPNNGAQGTHYAYTASNVTTTTDDEKHRGDIVYMWNVYGFAGGDATKPILTGTGTPIKQGILGDKFSAKNRAGSSHTLKAFYLERGGCDSNLEISTNLHQMTYKTAQAKKEWDKSALESDKVPAKVQVIRKAIARDDPSVVVGYATVGEPITLDSSNGWEMEKDKLPSEGYNPTGIYYDGKGEYTVTADGVLNPYGNRYCDYVYYIREIPLAGNSVTYDKVTGSGTDDRADLASEGIPVLDKMAYEIENANRVTSTTDVARYATDRETGKAYLPLSEKVLKDGQLDDENNFRYGVEDAGAAPTYVDSTTGKTRYLDYEYQLESPSSNGITIRQSNYALGEVDGTEPADSAAIPADFPEIIITNKPVHIKLLKQDADSTDTPKSVLVGAKFQLYKDAGDLNARKLPVYDADEDKLAENLVVVKGTGGNHDVDTFTTGEDGVLEFPKLFPGSYWIVETGAPEGYVLRNFEQPVALNVALDGTVTISFANPDAEKPYDTDKTRPDLRIVDKDNQPIMSDSGQLKPGWDRNEITNEGDAYEVVFPDLRTYALPATGGPGANAFLALGAFMTTLVAGCALQRKREKQ